MPRLTTIALIAWITLLILLPLYELADIGEHWPFDGEIVNVIFSTLFIFAALFVARRWGRRCLTALSRVRLTLTSTHRREIVRIAPDTRDESFLFLMLCHFRI